MKAFGGRPISTQTSGPSYAPIRSTAIHDSRWYAEIRTVIDDMAEACTPPKASAGSGAERSPQAGDVTT